MTRKLAWLVLAAIVWAGVREPASAVTARWTNGGGDGLWTNTNNWSSLAMPVHGTDIVIDNLAAPGPITCNEQYAKCKTLTFSRAGGFTITKTAPFSMLTDCEEVFVTAPNETYQIPKYSLDHPRFTVAAGSTLIHDGDFAAIGQTLTGPGTFHFKAYNNADGDPNRYISINANGTFLYENLNSYNIVLRALAGTGTLACVQGGFVLALPLTNFYSFSGWIDMRTPATGQSRLFIGTGTNAMYGLRARLAAGTRLAQRKSMAPNENLPPSFDDAVFAGNGLIEFSGPEAGQGYGSGLTNTMTACTLQPGLEGAGVLTFMCDPYFVKRGTNACQYLCQVTNVGSTAGSDYDQLAVIQTFGSSTYLGGYVGSASSPANPLADCDLVVDLSALAPNTDCSAHTLTNLTARNNFTGASFNRVTWINGSGTVNYNNGSVTLTGVRSAPYGTQLYVQ